MTGAGFFTYFSVPREIQGLRGAPSFSFGDVHAALTGLKEGGGFLITVNKGYFNDLEGGALASILQTRSPVLG
jgi:hypothetical protein